MSSSIAFPSYFLREGHSLTGWTREAQHCPSSNPANGNLAEGVDDSAAHLLNAVSCLLSPSFLPISMFRTWTSF